MYQRSLLLFTVTACLVGASSAWAQKKSLVIGIDGMGYGTRGFSVANTPYMDSLIDGSWAPGYNGAYSDQAFAGGVVGTATQQPTYSGPGWSTILTGVWADRHSVYGNSFNTPDYVNNPIYLGDLKAGDNSLRTASFSWWHPTDAIIIASVDVDNDPSNNMDFRLQIANNAAITANAVEKLDMDGVDDFDPDVIFINFDEVDGAGHSYGGASQQYQDEIEETDGQVGQLLSTIVSRPDFDSEDWQIIVTADHGHKAGGGHGGHSELERTVPFIVSSQSLRQGYLTTPIGGEVSHADVAPTVLDHFGVAIPGYYAGFSRAAGPGSDPDINGDTFVNQDDVTAFVALWLHPNTIDNPNPADLNTDGIADLDDAFILHEALKAAGGIGFDLSLLAAVPEPSTSVLVSFAAFTLFALRLHRSAPAVTSSMTGMATQRKVML